jgi:hypothetical protein
MSRYFPGIGGFPLRCVWLASRIKLFWVSRSQPGAVCIRGEEEDQVCSRGGERGSVLSLARAGSLFKGGTYLAVDARGSIERQHSRVACMILSLAGAILCPPACGETSRGWVRGERES